MKTRYSLLIALTLFMVGCTSIVGTTTNEPIADDLGKRTWGAKIDDSLIETKVAVNINKADTRLRHDSRIVVVSFNGIVLVAGQTPNASLKALAGKAASNSKVQGIKQVHNDLQIVPNASFTARMSDAWITGKIKTSMTFNGSTPASRIKVVTENGIVYLLGLLTRNEAKAAVEVARARSGVQKVVMLFEYIN